MRDIIIKPDTGKWIIRRSVKTVNGKIYCLICKLDTSVNRKDRNRQTDRQTDIRQWKANRYCN